MLFAGWAIVSGDEAYGSSIKTTRRRIILRLVVFILRVELFAKLNRGLLGGGVPVRTNGLHAIRGRGRRRQQHGKFINVLLHVRACGCKQNTVFENIEAGFVAGCVLPGEGSGLLETREEVAGFGQRHTGS